MRRNTVAKIHQNMIKIDLVQLITTFIFSKFVLWYICEFSSRISNVAKFHHSMRKKVFLQQILFRQVYNRSSMPRKRRSSNGFIKVKLKLLSRYCYFMPFGSDPFVIYIVSLYRRSLHTRKILCWLKKTQHLFKICFFKKISSYFTPSLIST